MSQPKVFIHWQDVGIGEGCMTDFVGAVCDLIDIMMEVIMYNLSIKLYLQLV